MTRSLVILGPGKRTETEVTCSAELIDLSRAFVEAAEALRKVYGEALAFNANVTLGDSPGGSIDHHDEVRGLAVMLAIRPFASDKEALFVPKCLRAFKRENLRETDVLFQQQSSLPDMEGVTAEYMMLESELFGCRDGQELPVAVGPWPLRCSRAPAKGVHHHANRT